jgi:hypothetical protein
MTEPVPETDEHFVEYYPGAGHVWRCGKSSFETLKGDLQQAGGGNFYYPFASQTEWGLASFLHNHLTLSEVDTFLRLRFVSPVILCIA